MYRLGGVGRYTSGVEYMIGAYHVTMCGKVLTFWLWRVLRCNACRFYIRKWTLNWKGAMILVCYFSTVTCLFGIFQEKGTRTKKRHLKKTYGSHFQKHMDGISSQISQDLIFDLTWKYHYFEIIISTNILFICYKITKINKLCENIYDT